MKAMVMRQFGGVEELRIENVAVPTPGEGEILLKTSYAGVNPVDWKIREGFLASALPHQFPLILGWDVAGTVLSVGEGVSQFAVGDRVYAYTRKPTVQWGTYAEFVTVSESAAALTPHTLTDAQAAGVPLTALTAWQGLFDFAQLKAKQVVLVHAGAGGVGGFAIQFAKSVGATVISTATKAKHSYLVDLGADIVIDYSTEDFAQKVRELYPEGIDVVFDGVGGTTLARSFDLLKPKGVLVSIVDTPDATVAVEKNVKAGFVFVAPNGAQLAHISALLDAHTVKALPVEILPLVRAQEAHVKSQSHRTVGKMVLEVAAPSVSM